MFNFKICCDRIFPQCHMCHSHDIVGYSTLMPEVWSLWLPASIFLFQKNTVDWDKIDLTSSIPTSKFLTNEI